MQRKIHPGPPFAKGVDLRKDLGQSISGSTSAAAITIQFASRLPNLPTAADLKRWARGALGVPATLTLRIVNAAEGQRLNRDFRGKDYPTNVLTFVYHAPGAARLEGDIVLCAPAVAREAREQAKPRPHHYAHLVVHGVLHLAGWDHEHADDARAMEAEEVRILARWRIPDPYANHGSL